MNSILDKCFMDRLIKWTESGTDNKIEEACNLFDTWEAGFEDDEKRVVSDLVKNFNYYSKNKVHDIIHEVDKRIISKYRLDKDNTIISVIRKDVGLKSSSSDYWTEYSYISSLGNKVFFDSLDEFDIIDWSSIKNIVFIDDCSGTGKTIKKFINREEKKLQDRGLSLKGKNIVIVVMEIMEEAVTFINNYASKEGFIINVEPYQISEKAFKSAGSTLKKDYTTIANKKKIRSILGFENTEALMSFYNNSPNNTLGLFWENTDSYQAIFPRRDDDEPAWLKAKKAKKNRGRERLESKKHNG